MELGRLEKVELRDVWTTEAGDFTPWLAGEENVRLLGDTIGLDLEVEAQEKDVGPFRADILCKDTASGDWVLIENQLERTDHTHLGQLMTYAAGLNTVTIVWVASRFTEEHRAALDWLNDITNDDFRFFGLEVELWRIGNSAIAPKFNMVSKPNDWVKSISGAAKRIDRETLTETKRLQLEYWTAFHEVLAKRGSHVKGTKPLPQYWNDFAIGRAGFQLSTRANVRDGFTEIVVYCSGPYAYTRFLQLKNQREEIEREIGESLDWQDNPNKKDRIISLKNNEQDPNERSNWSEQHEWLANMLERFHRAFSPRVKLLDDTLAETGETMP